MSTLYLIGDIHGQYDKLVRLLSQSGLVDSNLSWTGGDSALWFMGDFFDRGPRSIEAVSLVMCLQEEAAAAGGQVGAVIGNHEVIMLGAYRFGSQPTSGIGGTFMADWTRNGGNTRDLPRLTPQHLEWVMNLPALALVGDRLIVHADATFYTAYGKTRDEVNHSFSRILRGNDSQVLDRLLDDFSQRDDFLDINPDGESLARKFLDMYGGKQIIHGHSPILRITRQHADRVTSPLIYASGLCVNLDGGMYLGGPGFIHETTL